MISLKNPVGSACGIVYILCIPWKVLATQISEWYRRISINCSILSLVHAFKQP